MFIDMHCVKLQQLVERFKAAVDSKNASHTAALMHKFTTLFPPVGESTTKNDTMSTPGDFKATKTPEPDRIKLFNLREIDLFFDTFKSLKGSGMPLPRGVKDSDLEELEASFMEHFI
ncbi:hypothetical protein HDU98_011875, partial [Podochytrium sp. JEL0797]